MVLLNPKIIHMRQRFEALQEQVQAAKVELKVHATKTKEIEDSFPGNAGNISYAGEILEWVTGFTDVEA